MFHCLVCVCVWFRGWLLVSKRETSCERVPLDRIMLPLLIDPKQIKCLFSATCYLKIWKQRHWLSSILEWRCATCCYLNRWSYFSFIIFGMWIMMMIIIIQIAWHSSEERPAGGACAPLFSRFGFRSSLCVCPPVPQFDHPGQCKDTLFVCTKTKQKAVKFSWCTAASLVLILQIRLFKKAAYLLF